MLPGVHTVKSQDVCVRTWVEFSGSDLTQRAMRVCLRERMRSSEREMLTDVDLHILRAQLFLLKSEAINVLSFLRKENPSVDRAA